MNNSHLNQFLKNVRVAIYMVLDKFLIIGCSYHENPTVLLIRLDNIGDFILWLNSAVKLRQHFADKKLVLFASHTFVDLAESCGYFDQIVPVDVKRLARNPLYRCKVLRLVRKLGAQLAIHPNFSRSILAGDSIIRASGSSRRIGSAGDLSTIRPWQRRISDCWYTKLVPANGLPLMELERNSEFLRGLGVANAVPAVAHLPNLTELPASLQISQPYFILFPGASWIGKMWPVTSFAACLDALSRRSGWTGVLCGTTIERELCQSVINAASANNAINLAGKTSLQEFAELLRGARLLISNDTSAVHIAAAVGTPSVCILGGGNFGRFLPYSDSVAGVRPLAVFRKMPCYDCNWVCSQPHKVDTCVPCIGCIEIEDVLRAAEEILRVQKVY